LNLAGSDEVKRLAKPEEIEMRIVASGARRDLGELDAAVITLTCKELRPRTKSGQFAFAMHMPMPLRLPVVRQKLASGLRSAQILIMMNSLTP
jgi:hypothetical protein